jgi:hypothetical protein
MAKRSFEHKDIIKLLSDLKEETPDYPVHMMSSKKAAFMQKALEAKISADDRSGEGGQKGGKTGSGGAGGSGAALKGGTFILGISLRRAIAIGVIIVTLTTAYLLRDQITDFLVENEIVNVEETAATPFAPRPVSLATRTPTPATPYSGGAQNGSREEPDTVGPGSTGASPGQDSGEKPGTSDGSDDKGPGAAFRFLFCILQLRGDSCR